MIKIENAEVVGWGHAIRGMRNPMNSWDKSDSEVLYHMFENWKRGEDLELDKKYDKLLDEWKLNLQIGKNDLNLMKKLCNAGSDHRKFMRMITVYVDFTLPHFAWFDLDTYKVGTVKNGCSKMHKIHVKEFVKDDFSHEGIDEVGSCSALVLDNVMQHLEWLRCKFNETHEKKYWRAMLELLPMGYNIKATMMLNYEVLTNIYHARKNHKLQELREICKWIESLPYSELITECYKKKPSKNDIVNILVNSLNYAYCDNCDNCGSIHCDDCHRKYQNWSLSEQAAEEIAEQIMKSFK